MIRELGFAGVQKGNAMRGILLDLLSDSYQSSLPAKGGISLPQDMVSTPMLHNLTIISP